MTIIDIFATLTFMILGSLSILLELAYRAPEMDDDGHITGPSLREEERAERRR